IPRASSIWVLTWTNYVDLAKLGFIAVGTAKPGPAMSEARQGDVVGLVARVYAAIDDTIVWNEVVSELATLLDAQGASLFIDAGAGQEPLLASTHPALQTMYLERYRPLDPFQAPSLVARMS